MDDYHESSVNSEEPTVYIPNPNFVDLEEMNAPFILETKRIRLPEFPDAFNPSILRFQGSLLLCFRTYEPVTRSTNKIGLVWLDEDFNPKSKPQFLEISKEDPYCIAKRQDPRLIAIGERLFIAYSNVLKLYRPLEVRRMVIAEVFYNGKNFSAETPDCLIHYEAEKPERSEKNWVPFVYHGNLLLAYSLIPHRILLPLLGKSECFTIASTFGNIKWNWGVLRGGTQAFLQEDGEYLSFFHSSKSMATAHSNGQNIPHYFMGAYTFSGSPPFNLTRISPRPIVGPKFYHGPAHKTWKPLRVVFPGGYIFNDRYLWIVYGRQDHEMWVAKIDKEGLFNTLIPIK
ncbi:MAG TPA: hypothetical protein VLE89_08380 [Chlamydiales bacterium]|nr:hypothetical protein [Chlamydiales bacterium]